MTALTAPFYSCTEKKDKPENQKEYFDLNGFIRQEIQSLTREDPEIHKSVNVNGDEEASRIKIDDWERELSAFIQSDINKPALAGNYFIDSVQGNGILTQLNYTAKKEYLKTRSLSISFDEQNNPIKIVITLAKTNVLFKYEQELAYVPRKGYSIAGKQILKFLGENDFSVKTEFLF